jgi:uncharacterized membrane-anchored protein
MPTPWMRIVAALAVMSVVSAHAQESAERTLSPEQQAYQQKLEQLHWVDGPATVATAGNSQLTIPDGFTYLDSANTLKFLELNQNLGSGDEVMVAPQSLEWQAYLSFVDEGYVKDDEKIDADALLKSLQESTREQNPERQKRGWSALTVVGWARPPAYNAATKRLEWATILESENGRGANFFTKVLGRRGHASIQMVASESILQSAESSLNDVLAGYTFRKGDTYAEFKSGDKIAEYGLAAMVLGGAAAVATKKGFWGVLAGFFAAAWKFVAAAAVAAVAGLKRLIRKKE